MQDNNADALEMGRKLILGTGDATLQSQISFMKHNFFSDQPVSADAYIFRHILHDWNDADSLAIIKSLLPALKTGSRVFISEGLLPDPPATTRNTLTDKMILYVPPPIMPLIYPALTFSMPCSWNMDANVEQDRGPVHAGSA